MKHSVRLGVALALLGVAVVVACSRSDISQYTHGGAEDGGGDAKGDAILSGCVHALAPSRPTRDDDAGTPDIEFYDAVQSIDFGDAGAPVGLDLDETCTCPAPDSCIVAGDAGTRCDLANGVDNAYGALVQSFSSATNIFNPTELDARLASGGFGLLIRVKRYNGQANDTQVELAVFASAGTQNGAIPSWDGTDVWTLDPASLLGGAIASEPVPLVAYDLNAYVSNFTLVGNISDLPFVLVSSDGSVAVDLNGAVVTAPLEPSGSSFRIAGGTIAGRWPSKKLVTSLHSLHDPLDVDASLCGTDAVYQLIKSRVCGAVDITDNVLDDNKGMPCGAMSFAFAFDGVPAKYGSVLAFDGGTGCGTSWSDQCP